jgi:Ala-tRNA(Pro) deacylase
MTESVNQILRRYLDEAGVSYRVVQHEPTTTSEASARARGEELRVGAKALVLKAGPGFQLCVLSAALKLDSSALKSGLGVSSVRFATPDELLTLTGLVPGAVPPFGRPVLPLDLFVDPSVLENPVVAFNAGSLTESIVMATEDYRRTARPSLLAFARPG